MNTKTLALAAGLALIGTAAAAQPFDSIWDNSDIRGWGPYWNSHLSPYDGRPLGPPLSALPPGSYYYNGRLVLGGYGYGYGPVVAPPPRVVRVRPHGRRRAHRY
jgi:hypothetical protein